MPEKNLYRILQVDPRANPEVVEAAYGALVRRLHPDRDSTDIDQYLLSELTRAYVVLHDPEERRAYDQQLATGSLVPVGPGANGETRQGASLAERVLAHSNIHVPAADHVIDFGRYAGWRLGDVVRQDPDYLRWLSRHSSGIRFRGAILQLLAEHDKQRVPSRPAR